MSTSKEFAAEIRYGIDIIAWCVERLGFMPDPWQVRVLSSDALQVILNITRQGGKSTVCGIVAAHRAIYYPGSLILLISRGQRQAGELYMKIVLIFRQLGVKLRIDNQMSSELVNGSRILCLPGDADSVRSFAPHVVIIDEASLVGDDVYNAVRPMLSVSRGRLFLISTPHGQQGFFHSEWFSGGPSWYREQVTAYQCPRILPEFLEAEKRRRGLFFGQEYEGKFEDGSAQLFSHNLIESLFSTTFAALPLRVIT